MNKIIIRVGRFLEGTQLLGTRVNFIIRKYSKDPKDDKELDVEEVYKVRKGMLHDKQQSLQEESYFHKEETEQLQQLKKKMKKGDVKKTKDDEKKD